MNLNPALTPSRPTGAGAPQLPATAPHDPRAKSEAAGAGPHPPDPAVGMGVVVQERKTATAAPAFRAAELAARLRDEPGPWPDFGAAMGGVIQEKSAPLPDPAVGMGSVVQERAASIAPAELLAPE